LRILFVGTAWSHHLSRWINQLNGQGWDIHLFPLNADEGVHPDLADLTVHDAIHGRPRGAAASVRAVDDVWPLVRDGYPFARGAMTARRIERNFFPRRADRAWRLAYAIRKLRPDIVHSMTIYPASDLIMQAREHLTGEFPVWMVSSWGSDIYLFPRLSQYAEKSRAALSSCDYFICDCQRDVESARRYGFRGEVLGVVSGAGGFDVGWLNKLARVTPTSRRRLIMMKGQQHIAGRALVGVRALELCADALRDYRLAVFYASPDVEAAVELLSQATGIPATIVSKVPYEELLELFGSARVSIGLGISDGLPLSLLEAMAMGAFPVQSGTSCADEWTLDGETCLIVPPEDPEAVAAAVRRAVSDDALVDAAAETNARVVAEQFDNSVLRPRIVAMYEQAFTQGRRARAATPGS
jgi:glycosyltransferase involved in cell wall biosynthesis